MNLNSNRQIRKSFEFPHQVLLVLILPRFDLGQFLFVSFKQKNKHI